MQEAWKIISEKIYIDFSDIGKGDLTNSKPSLKGYFNWTVNPGIKYKNSDLAKAWKLLILAKGNTDTYNDDLTVVGKQVLGNIFVKYRDEFTQAYEAKDVAKMKIQGQKNRAN
jgi:alpha-N-acetylglucosaminidase